MLTFSHAMVGLALFVLLGAGPPVRAGEVLGVEVFTTAGRPVTGAADDRLRAVGVTTYAVDGLERFESRLSEGLPADAKAAKAEALRRVQQLDDVHLAPAKSAAIGLAKAVQYGVDRYPAIVFDRRSVVYGVTDLVEALDRYDAWQREQAR